MNHTAKEHVLSNGMRLMVIDVPGSRNFDMVIALNSGYRFANKNNMVAYEAPHILEHMIFDGSSRYPTPDDLHRVFNTGGGEWNGITTAYNNLFTFHNRIRNAESVIDASINAVFHPLLTEESYREEKQVVENELEEHMGDFSLNADQYTQQQILPDNPVSTDTQLTRLPVVAYEDVLAFHRQYFGTANARVVILCDLKQFSLRKIKSAVLDASHSAPRLEPLEAPEFTVQPSPGAIAPVKIGRSIEDAYLSLQYVVGGRVSEKQMAMLDLFCAMASGMNSYSVNYKLRKKGLIYGLNLGCARSKETYCIEFNISATNKKIVDVVGQTLTQTLQFLQEGVSQEQFEDFKSEAVESLDDSIASDAGIMGWYLDNYVVEGSIKTPDERKEIINSISQEEMQAFVKSVLRYENQYGTLFSAKSKRISLHLTILIDEIMKNGMDGREIGEIIHPLKGLKGDFNSYYEPAKPGDSRYKRFFTYINTRPLIAWLSICFVLALGSWLTYLGASYLDGWSKILVMIIGIVMVSDAVIDSIVRIYRYSKNKI